MTVTDPFFDLKYDTNWNACIGRQGDQENYADGYIEAAIVLATGMLEKGMYDKIDTLVLPILYNARHSIELTLKLVIGEFVGAGILAEGHATNHDIASHLQFLEKQGVADELFRETLKLLKPYVDSLSKVDDDGQELRYHENRDGRQSMEDKALANIVVIAESLEQLQAVLRTLKTRAYELRSEWYTGTWTRQCSRRDLNEITKLLPQRSEWASQAFIEAKDAIQSRYGLSNTQFSKTLNKIQETRPLAGLIGVESNLVYLTGENAEFILAQWAELHPPREPSEMRIVRFSKDDFAKILAGHEKEAEIIARIVETVPEDQFADAETIYYIERNGNYPERYEEFLELKRNEFRARGDLRQEVHDLMSKTNFRRHFLNGLAAVGIPSLSNRLHQSSSDAEL
ncbi:hypothetical protein [Ruegeria meonggei]|uniref:hypothetical protein n=1 Tax=Ruegeria meonggei TaxID=1446476 RepID=UPI00366CD045